MKNIRLILWLAFTFLLIQIYSKWVVDHAPEPVEQVQVNEQNSNELGTTENINNSEDNNNSSDKLISIKTDVLDVKISTLGGDVVYTGLPSYPLSLEQKDKPVQLLGNTSDLYFVSQTGILSKDKDSANNFQHFKTQFQTLETSYELGEKEELIVELTSTNEQGMQLTKRYTFKKGAFDIGFEQQLTNQSGSTWTGSEYRQLAQTPTTKKSGFVAALFGDHSTSYVGGVISAPDQDMIYEKIAWSDMEKGKRNAIETNGTSILPAQNAKGGWAAMLQHYFMAAWIPDQDETNDFYIDAQDGRYFLGLKSIPVTIENGQTHSFKSKLYIGPKSFEKLEKVAPNLELTVDFGSLSFLSNLMLKILSFYHGIIGNWGWSIMLLTLTVKACLFYFADKGYRSMARMKKFTPELTRIKESYPDDPAKRNQAMMELYRKEKINPMSGCWPMLIQIPIFLALYWMLSETVEIRQMPWILWIKDLSVRDPSFILPIIMGLTMFIQQRLNPPPPDPMQAKIMTYLPIFFTFLFLTFPAGLVLYWITNNTLSILQQYIINRRIEASAK